MKKTLLISSALASGIIYSGSALAQTTVSGQLDLHYKAMSFDGAGTSSVRGIGREAQLNVQSKGKLNNGMDYAAGFSLEFDGQNGSPTSGTNSNASSTETNTVSNENVPIVTLNVLNSLPHENLLYVNKSLTKSFICVVKSVQHNNSYSTVTYLGMLTTIAGKDG